MTRLTSRMMSQSGSRFNSAKRWSLAVLSVLVVGAVAEQSMAMPQPRPVPIELEQSVRPQATTRVPRMVIRRIQRDLMQRENISRRDLRVVSATRNTWTDGCLGLGGPAESCIATMVEGYRIEFTNDQQNWVYRSDRTGRNIRPELIGSEPEVPMSLPTNVQTRVLQTIASQVGVPAGRLRITETQRATWDGCMGIYEPDQACTMIAIFGYRIIVTDSNQNWVYHINQNGDQVVQNAIASVRHNRFMTTFIPEGNNIDPSPITEPIIFRSSVSGGIGGFRTEKVLMASGILRTQTLRLNMPTGEVTERRISLEEVAEFQQLLEAQRFPNLNRMRYITDAAFADYPTTVFEGMGSQVEYIDLVQDDLPPSLQNVITAWERL
ncbi:hypothetical protein ACQ4M4_03145 [Leptolyngbya sp. AN02str]|uniref:hypothetical protein n=1 Tax=Leptolyngbya sp. AN02str TaxID=3423363 RepID=UPI003D313A50